MTIKEKLATFSSALAKYEASCAGVVRGKVRNRFGSKYVILALALVIVGIGAVACIRKGHPIAALISRSVKHGSPVKSHPASAKPKPSEPSTAKPAETPASKPAEAHATKPAEAPATKLAEAPAARIAEPPATKVAEPPTQKLAPNSLMAQRMTRSCENLAKPTLMAESSTGADVYAVAVCKQFGLWKQGQPALQRND